MKNLKISALFIIGIVFSSIISCSNNDSTYKITVTTEVPAVYKKIYGATSISSDGTYIYIKTKDLPDHKSTYYPTTNALYESYSGTTFGGNTFVKNPNSIIEQTTTVKLPLNPVVASTHAATPLGAIGIAINGVAFFNQYAGPKNQALTGEIATFRIHYLRQPLELE